MSEKCAYCGHPQHQDFRPELTELPRERAAALWDARGPQHSIAPGPFECEAIHALWARMPGHTTYANAFDLIRREGFRAAIMNMPLRQGDRVCWRGRAATVAYARVNGNHVQAYSIVLDDQHARAGYTGTIVSPAELTDVTRQLTRNTP